MPVTAEQWKQLYAVFNPAQRLELADADLFVERPGAVATKIARSLKLEPSGKWVVCGSMGSGKSSELAHLGGLLQHDFAVVGLDLPNTVASVDRLQAAEVLFLIGVAAIRAASELWDHAISEPATRRLVDALTPLLAPTSFELQPSEFLQGVALFVGNVVAPGVSAVAGALGGAARAAGGTLKKTLQPRRPSPLNGITRPVQEGEPDLIHLQEAVEGVLDEIAAVRAPIVLVDGLDKIQDIGSIRRLFSSSRILALPRRPIVYTGPISLMLATEWQAASGHFRRERLTNVVVRPPSLPGVDITASKIEAGRAALHQVVEKRLALVGLAPSDVFADGCLDLLIQSSGGVLRNLILVIRYTVEGAFQDSLPQISREIAEEAVSSWRRDYEITMNTMRRQELVHVLEHGEPSGRDPSLELLLNGYILPYSNGKIWFEPHPVLRDGLVRSP